MRSELLEKRTDFFLNLFSVEYFLGGYQPPGSIPEHSVSLLPNEKEFIFERLEWLNADNNRGDNEWSAAARLLTRSC